MLFVSLGADDEIGASCHYLKLGRSGVFLDAGADPEEEGEASLPHFEVVSTHRNWRVDHVVLTHAHHDHVGSLPAMMRAFPHLQVHMTGATRDLVDLLLPASARLQRRKLQEGSTTSPPLFSEEELGAISYLYETHALGETFELEGVAGGPAPEARFLHAGHVLGAAGVEISVQENGAVRRLFYTGDTNVHSQSIIAGGEYPESSVDVLVIESTLCSDPDAELVSRQTEERRLEKTIAATLERGGAVLIPVFALGRAQEILCLVDRFKKRGTIAADVPIYTAGTMRAVSELYDRTRFSTPRLNEEFEVLGVDQSRLPRGNDRVAEMARNPAIFVLASGMMFERTASNRVAQLLIGDPGNAVCIVGFSREDSPADRLLVAASSGEEEVTIAAATGAQDLRCRVERFRLTGHASRRDLLDLVSRLAPKKVVIVHGTSESRQWLADNISYFHAEPEIHIPRTGVPIEL